MPPSHPARRHPAIATLMHDRAQGALDRREFITRATALGLAAPLALRLGGAPAQAQPAIAPGGTLRIQQLVKPMGDPRTYDWSEIGNQSRGFLEYLVEYQADGSFRPMLLESWEIDETATTYVLNIRPGIQWHNGDPLTARDVARNITGWCDRSLKANSMASRMTALIDPATSQAREGAIKVTDELTVTLSLSTPDVALIANFSDYPAAITHETFSADAPFDEGIGTGPFRPVSLEVGVSCVLERFTDRPWWGTDIYGGPHLDRVEFTDRGTDPITWIAAAEADEVDLLYESIGDFVEIMDTLGWTRSETRSTATIVLRANQTALVDGITPYADARTRRALAMAVDNAILLELGYGDRGELAANHHVSPMHPEYADIGPSESDPAAALALLDEVGLADYEHELITVDDDWQRNTGDAAAAQMRDAGIPVRRRILPGAIFWKGWTTYPLSATQWNHRPLGVQLLTLAYRSGEAWNESGYANPEFDALIDKANGLLDAASRREVMAKLEQMLRTDGVIIQPFWRTLYTHHVPALVGADKHPSHEIHLYKIGFST